jgi:hypothetical protein
VRFAQAIRGRDLGPILQSIKTIAWAFLGIRGSKRLEMDFESLSILHIIVAGLISTAVFIGTLLIVIHWVVLKLNS